MTGKNPVSKLFHKMLNKRSNGEKGQVPADPLPPQTATATGAGGTAAVSDVRANGSSSVMPSYSSNSKVSDTLQGVIAADATASTSEPLPTLDPYSPPPAAAAAAGRAQGHSAAAGAAAVQQNGASTGGNTALLAASAAATVSDIPAATAAAAAAAAGAPSPSSSSTAGHTVGFRSSAGGGSANTTGGGKSLSQSLGRRSVGALHLSRDNHAAEAFKVRVGVCAMDRKAQSKPMKEIISRLISYGDFEVVNFGDETILHKPIIEWPRVDCLMSWHSNGFPLEKAQAYADLTRPFLINDLNKQTLIQDRRAVYKILVEAGIAVPHHIVVNRDGLEAGQDPPGFVQEEDYVELDGVRIDKPFVEKPVSGEDHNIHIYYPCSMGGGVKRLFRKVDNKSSCYDPHHNGRVRTDGSYIYEEFLPTGGTDVKVYTVGPRYAHAEARKSPVVDGRVLRTPDGKEMRFPVLLNPAEKEISRTVCLAFGQKVCGFDLLRSEKGKSYVCDVNGWSFVKNSKKYYDDAAGILRRLILQALAPHRLSMSVITPGVPLSFSMSPVAQQAALAAAAASGVSVSTSGMGSKTTSLADMANLCELSETHLLEATKTDERSTHEELRCVLAVVRHGDRTPKQKLKVRVRHPELLALFARHADSKGKQAKLKSPNQLQELLDISRSILQELEHPPPPGLSEEEIESREETREKLRIVKTVLEQGGQFSGINRKVQLKPLTWAPAPAQQQAAAADGSAAEPAGAGAGAAAVAAGNVTPGVTPAADSTALQPTDGTSAAATAADGVKLECSGSKSDSGSKSEGQQVLTEALLILKYGGVLTHAGRAQAEELGKIFRLVMYPNYGSTGGGLLRLHSTYRHDFKIYSSDEGRVQVAAAAFTKGLLDLEGSSLTPILVSLVAKDASMLDAFGKGASEDIMRSKQVLYNTMTWDPETASSVSFVPNYRKHLYAASPSPLAAPSPPFSPATMSRASSSGFLQQQQQQQQQMPEPALSTLAVAAAAADAQQQQQQQQGLSTFGSDGGPAAATAAATAGGGTTWVQPAGAELVRKDIPHMPDAPLNHLKKLNEHMKNLVEQLRELVLAEKRTGLSSTASSSAKELAGAPASPQQQQQHEQQQQQQQKPDTETQAAAARAALSGTGPEVSASNPAVSAGQKDSPQRPSTAPSIVGSRTLSGGGSSGGAAAGISGTSGTGAGRYSSLSCDPADWELQQGKPCSGEALLLMFDRWQKLAKTFYKKGKFDISKVPDIYDSAKYDTLHNNHLGLSPTLELLYKEAKVLADAVIPNEYGIDPQGKLAIGSKIATELLAKLLDDLRASKEESLATLTDAERAGATGTQPTNSMPVLGRKSMPHMNAAAATAAAAGSAGAELPAAAAAGAASGGAAGRTTSQGSESAGFNRSISAGAALGNAAAAAAAADEKGLEGHASGDEAEVEGFAGDDEGFDFDEPEVMHRLCPSYASDINSPLRHVRTRIYFTSESHMHSLVNLLRFCHLKQALMPSSISSNTAASRRGSMDAAAGAAAGADPAAAAAAATGVEDLKVSRSSSNTGGSSSYSPVQPAAGSNDASGSNAGSSSSSSSSNSAAPQQQQQQQHLARCPTPPGPPPEPLLSEQGIDLLSKTTELDYLTHLVFRLYENKSVPADHPLRFKLEILFSPGAAYNPTEVIPVQNNHTMPPRSRVTLHKQDGCTLTEAEKLLRPFAAKKKKTTT